MALSRVYLESRQQRLGKAVERAPCVVGHPQCCGVPCVVGRLYCGAPCAVGRPCYGVPCVVGRPCYGEPVLWSALGCGAPVLWGALLWRALCCGAPVLWGVRDSQTGELCLPSSPLLLLIHSTLAVLQHQHLSSAGIL